MKKGRTIKLKRSPGALVIEVGIAADVTERVATIEDFLHRSFFDEAKEIAGDGLEALIEHVEREEAFVRRLTDADIASMAMDEVIGFWDGETVPNWDYSDNPIGLTRAAFNAEVEAWIKAMPAIAPHAPIFREAGAAALAKDRPMLTKRIGSIASALGWKKRKESYNAGAAWVRRIWFDRPRDRARNGV